MARTRPVRLTVVLAGAAALAACGGPSAPDGWRDVEVPGVSFDLPEGWVETGALNERWAYSWQDDAGEDASVQVAVAPALGYYDAFTAQGMVMSSAQIGGMPGFRVVENHDPADLGRDSREFRRLDFTYEPDDGQGVHEGVLWTASVDRQHQAVGVQLTGKDLDTDVVALLEASIVATGQDG